MAFLKSGFALISGGLSEDAPRIFGYTSTTDTTATIKASAYFNNVANELAVDEPIYIIGSDGMDFVRVTAVTPNVTVASIISGSTEAYIIEFAGEFTTVGGSPTENFTVTGAASTDLLFTQMKVVSGTPVNILAAAPGTDQISMTFSADPSNNHTFAYQLLRPAA